MSYRVASRLAVSRRAFSLFLSHLVSSRLVSLLPLLVQQLLFGKGRGTSFVTEHISQVRRAASRSDEEAKAIIREILSENFFHELSGAGAGTPRNSSEDVLVRGRALEHAQKHLLKLVELFFALLMRRAPWSTWTNDIYDAMRCIDHLPIG